MIKEVTSTQLKLTLNHSLLVHWAEKEWGTKKIDLRRLIAKGTDQYASEVCEVTAIYLPAKVSTVWGIACIESILTVHSGVVKESLKRLTGWSKKALKATEDKIEKISEELYEEWDTVGDYSCEWQYRSLMDLLAIPFDQPKTPGYSVTHALNSASNSAGIGKSSRELDYRKKNIAYSNFAKLGLLYWDTACAHGNKNNQPRNGLDLSEDT